MVKHMSSSHGYELCCSTKHGLDDRRRAVDHFLPQGPSLEPRYTYRLEKVEELDMERLRARFRLEANAKAQAGGHEAPGSLIDLDLASLTAGGEGGAPGAEAGREQKMDERDKDKEPDSASDDDALLLAVSKQLQARLGAFDAPLVGEERYLLVETPISAGKRHFVTRQNGQVAVDEEDLERAVAGLLVAVAVDEEELERAVVDEAGGKEGLLFVSNTFALATFE
ncbi:hypothetical protein T484DRAFT_1860536, partial [Baffinella frigidus]